MPDPFDRLLERTMKAGARTAEPCPPADTLAAFVDGSLSAAERAAIERHAADCQPCAEHLALLSGLEPVSSGDQPTSQRAWWRSWTWLVPVAASVVVAAVWVSLPREAQVPTAEADRGSSAARSAPAPPVPARPAPSSPVVDTIAPAPSAIGGVAPTVRRQSIPAKLSAPTSVQSAPAAAGERLDQPPQVAAQAPASAPADSAAVKPQSADLKDKADEEQRQRSEAANTAREAVAAPAPPPTPAAPAGSLSAARRGQAESAGFLAKSEGKKEAAGTTLEAADASGTRWRITGSAIERSSDGGITWQDAHAPALAGAAFITASSPDVCWVATPSGDVLRHASDGTWTRSRVPVPDVITALTTTSATDAVVTTANHRRFETKNGGVTWTLLPD